MSARFRIVGTDLPGRTCGPSRDQPEGYSQIEVGVQRGKEVVDGVPGDAAEAVFEFDVDIRNDHLDPADIDGRTVEGRLTLTDGRGHPLCASVRPPQITWRVLPGS